MSVFRTSNRNTSNRNMSNRNMSNRSAGHPSASDAHAWYPLNRMEDRVRDDAVPDGPTERIGPGAPGTVPGDKASRVRNRSVFLVAALALFALNVAMLAGYVAWRALVVARADGVAGRPGKPGPSGKPAKFAPSATPSMTAGGSAPGVAGYTVTYAQEPLRVQVGCSAIMFLDLDEPRANADQQVSDLRYDSRCGRENPRLTLGPGAAAGSQISDADTDAAGCEKAIRTSPLGSGASVEVRKGAVLCVLTAASPAEMVLLEITDVGTTGTAGMRATSWKVSG